MFSLWLHPPKNVPNSYPKLLLLDGEVQDKDLGVLRMEQLPEIRQPLHMHENASVFYGHALISCLKIRCKPDIYVNLSHFTHNQAEFLLHNTNNEQQYFLKLHSFFYAPAFS